jgi:hypothetical protein
MERKLVAKTGKGTRDWTPEEMKELLTTGKVKGYAGHHMNTKAGDLQLAADPDNVEFLPTNVHIDTHRAQGGTAVQISGRAPLDRTDGGTIAREYGNDGYAIRSAARVGVGILTATATTLEVLDYLDPATYMFYIKDAQ